MEAGKKCLVLQRVMFRDLRLVNLGLEHGEVLKGDWLHNHGKSVEKVQLGEKYLASLQAKGEEGGRMKGSLVIYIRGGVVVMVQASGLHRWGLLAG